MPRNAGKYDWRDSNMELFGSREDRIIKKSSAETEPAWKPVITCDKPALFVWRIQKFQVVGWPTIQYGEFYEGDSYIVLNVYRRNDEVLYDIHFWIGKYSTQDEYGTAAYKTVELDTLLDDKPVQHREVQHYESALFKSYFPTITHLKGGHETGFRHLTTHEYVPRLLRFSGEKRNIVITELSPTRQNLKSDDVFIYDTGLKIYQWIGKGANKDEKVRAQQFAQQLNADRNGKMKINVLDESGMTSSNEFYKKLSDSDPEDEDQYPQALSQAEKQLFRITDASGTLNFEKISIGKSGKSEITEDDVFLFDNGQVVYVYVGENANPNERKNGLVYAHNYLKNTEYPQVSITVLNKRTSGPNADQFYHALEN